MDLRFDAREGKNLLKLALPILLGGIANVGMGFADSVMAGQVSAEDLAGISLAVSVIILLVIPATGIMMAVTPIIAGDHGAGDLKSIPGHFYQLFYLGLVLSVITLAFVLLARWSIGLFELADRVREVAQGYLGWAVLGIPFVFGFNCLRSLTEGVSCTRLTMIVSFVGLGANVVFNYIFIYGKFGIPAMGGVGCAIATVLVQTIMFFAMIIVIRLTRSLRQIPVFTRPPFPDPAVIRHYLKIGLPIVLAMFFEIGLFSFFAFVTIRMGTVAMAANQIFFNYMTLIYILPMSLSQVVSIRVGYYIGQKNATRAQLAASTALITGLVLAVSVAVLSYIFKTGITKLYSSDDEVISLVSSAFLCVCVYQLGDYCQTIGIGILRGLQDNKIITYASIIVYWLIAVPAGLTLAFTSVLWGPHDFAGLWMGLSVSLYVLGVTYLFRVNYSMEKLKKHCRNT